MRGSAVTEGHGVSLTASGRQLHERRILTELKLGTVRQRSLSRNLGIALGLTNLLMRRLVHRGWVRVIHIKSNRVRYLITPAGIAEKARMSRDYFAATTRFYAETRDSVRNRFAELSARWPEPGVEKRIAFYGASEVAEIGFVCLQETDLRLVHVIDDERTKPFFGLTISRTSMLRDIHRNGDEPFSFLIVMSFDAIPEIRERLRALSYPQSRVRWLDNTP